MTWLQRLAAELARLGVTDANESITFSRELEGFIGQAYEMEFVELIAQNLFPADPAVDPADTSYTTRRMRNAAQAHIVANWNDDSPGASYDATAENNFPIRSVLNHYSLTIQDLRTARKLNRPLEAALAESCKRAHAEVFEQVCFFGDSTFGLKGLFSDSGVTGNGTTKVGVAWDDAAITAAIILADVERMFQKIVVDTKQIHRPTTLAVPTEASQILAMPRDFGGGIYDSLENLILRTYKSRGLQEIVYAPKLDIGTTGASGGAPRVLLYKKDPRVLAHQTPIFFEQFPPQADGAKLRVECHSRIGGVHVEEYKAITFMDGCTT